MANGSMPHMYILCKCDDSRSAFQRFAKLCNACFGCQVRAQTGSVHGSSYSEHQQQCKQRRLCGSLVDELHDLLKVPHEAIDTAHQVLDKCPSHSCLSLSQFALLLQVSQQKADELNDSHYKATYRN